MYAGWFLGDRLGGTLARDTFELSPGLFTGFWLGYDLSHYWGSEIRLGLDYANVTYLPDGQASTNSRNPLFDFSLLYYPWGDSRWRPYGAVGLGVGGFFFSDALGYPVDQVGLCAATGSRCEVLVWKSLGAAFRCPRQHHLRWWQPGYHQ